MYKGSQRVLSSEKAAILLSLIVCCRSADGGCQSHTLLAQPDNGDCCLDFDDIYFALTENFFLKNVTTFKFLIKQLCYILCNY